MLCRNAKTAEITCTPKICFPQWVVGRGKGMLRLEQEPHPTFPKSRTNWQGMSQHFAHIELNCWGSGHCSAEPQSSQACKPKQEAWQKQLVKDVSPLPDGTEIIYGWWHRWAKFPQPPRGKTSVLYAVLDHIKDSHRALREITGCFI